MSHTKLENKSAVKSPESAKTQKWRRPQYDVSENDEGFDVEVSLPGVKREAVDITIEGDQLTIVGTRTAVPSPDWRPLRRELKTGDFRLDIQLNVAIQTDRINARVENGMLELSLPKADIVKPRKITVS